jgi:outer membrane protein assembly factor BamB
VARLNGFPGGPAIGEDGTIYVATGGDNVDRGAGSLYAINPDGTLRWRFQFPLLGTCRQVAASTTPAIADDGTIYVHTQPGYTPSGAQCTAGDSYLFAVRPNGTEKWHFAFNGGAAVFSGDFLSSPTIGADGTIYATSADTGLYAIDPADGNPKWVVSPSATSIEASPAVGPDGTIYVSVFDLHAYKPDGSPKWTADLGNGAPNEASPSVGGDGTIYACFLNPDACQAVSPAGSSLWGVPFEAGPTTPALAADGTIYFGTGISTDDGGLAALGPDGSERWHRDFPFNPVDSPVIGSDGGCTRGSTWTSARPAPPTCRS